MTNQLTGSNESIAEAPDAATPNLKLRQDLMSALAPTAEAENMAGSSFQADSMQKRLSDDSQNSQGVGFFSRIKSKFTEVMNSARRSSFLGDDN